MSVLLRIEIDLSIYRLIDRSIARSLIAGVLRWREERTQRGREKGRVGVQDLRRGYILVGQRTNSTGAGDFGAVRSEVLTGSR